MKNVIISMLLAALLLTGCSSEPEVREPYTVSQDGISLTIDPQRKTITDGENLYTYTASERNISIYYPNGAVYSQRYYRQEDSVATMISGGWSSGETDQIQEAEQLYLDGDTLAYAVVSERPEQEEPFPVGIFLLALVIAAGGVLVIVNAEKLAYRRASVWVKDAEPSDTAIYVTIIEGLGMIAGGLLIAVLCCL